MGSINRWRLGQIDRGWRETDFDHDGAQMLPIPLVRRAVQRPRTF